MQATFYLVESLSVFTCVIIWISRVYKHGYNFLLM